MIQDPLEKNQGPSLWVVVAGCSAAALLTLTAAVGTSMLHQPTTEQAKSLEAPVVRR